MHIFLSAKSRPFSLLKLTLGTIFLSLASTAWAAGEVTFASGEVSALTAKGESRVLKRGDRVEAGETLVTGHRGEVHVIMDDRALLALRPDTRITIDDYRARGDSEDRARFTVVSGFIRSVTGWIGKIAPANYRVRTSTATIGIRGTDHEVGVVEGGPDAGTYDKVNEGLTRLANSAGEVDIAAGRAAFVAKNRPAPPRVLERIPPLFKAAENEKEIDAVKRSLAEDMDRRLRERQAVKGAQAGDCGPDGPAMRALNDFIRAYEAGDLAGITARLDPAMPGYQRFIDQLAREFATQKQIRIFVKDVQIQCGPDLANLILVWEKRFLDAATLQPGFFSGQFSVLMQRGNGGWRPGAFSGDSPFARAAGSAARFTFGPAFSLANVTPQGIQVPVTLEVLDADIAGLGTITIQVVGSNGDNENIALSEIAPGRFLRSTLQVSSQPPTPGNGTIEVGPGVKLTARYIDQQPGNHQPAVSLVRTLAPVGQLPVIQDTTPDAFAFPSASVAPGTVVTSAPIVIAGINAPAAVTVAGGEVSIAGGAFTAANGTISNGQSLQARGTASSTSGGVTTVQVTVGGVAGVFQIITQAPEADTTPEPFTFTPAVNITPSTLVTSNAVTITGINSPTPVSSATAAVSVNGGVFASNGIVNNGQTVSVRGQAPAILGQTTSHQVTIGGVIGTFQVSTPAQDTTPNPFAFTPVTLAQPFTTHTSNTVTITGINVPVPVSVVEGSASIAGGAFSNAPGTISNGQTLAVKGVSSGVTNGGVRSVVATVGTVSSTFSITTLDTTPNPILFPPTNIGCGTGAPATSSAVAVTGINTASPITITAPASYSVAGGPFVTGGGTISNNQTLTLKRALPAPGTSTTVTVTIGQNGDNTGTSATWTITCL